MKEKDKRKKREQGERMITMETVQRTGDEEKGFASL